MTLLRFPLKIFNSNQHNQKSLSRKHAHFLIKTTNYELNKTQDDIIRKYTGYSQESDIIPKTLEFSIQQKRCCDNVCTKPIVTTTTASHSSECIIVDDRKTLRKFIHWLK